MTSCVGIGEYRVPVSHTSVNWLCIIAIDNSEKKKIKKKEKVKKERRGIKKKSQCDVICCLLPHECYHDLWDDHVNHVASTRWLLVKEKKRDFDVSVRKKGFQGPPVKPRWRLTTWQGQL